MILFARLSRFGIVGAAATLIHTTILFVLVGFFSQPTGLANMVGFMIAFIASTSWQQAFTFNDRLSGKALKKRAISILFTINAILAYILGSQVRGPLMLILVCIPPIVNFLLLHFFSGHSAFKR